MKAKEHEKGPLDPDISLAIPNELEKPVTSAQLAHHLQITTRTLANWRADGIIPFWRINPRSFRYRIRDVEKALELRR